METTKVSCEDGGPCIIADQLQEHAPDVASVRRAKVEGEYLRLQPLTFSRFRVSATFREQRLEAGRIQHYHMSLLPLQVSASDFVRPRCLWFDLIPYFPFCTVSDFTLHS